jgi:hypothetical protein
VSSARITVLLYDWDDNAAASPHDSAAAGETTWRRFRSWMPYTGHSYIKLDELIQATPIVAAGIMVSYIMKR